MQATPTPAAPPVPADHQPTPQRDSDDLTGDAPPMARAPRNQVLPRWPTPVWGRTRHPQGSRGATTAAPLPPQAEPRRTPTDDRHAATPLRQMPRHQLLSDAGHRA